MLLPAATRVKPVQEDFFPVDFVSATLVVLFGLSLDFRLVLLFLFLRFDHLEEWIVEELLLEMLLEVEQWHVQQIHRLIQARIDLQLLFELSGLRQTRFHAASPPRSVPSPFDEAKRDRN